MPGAQAESVPAIHSATVRGCAEVRIQDRPISLRSRFLAVFGWLARFKLIGQKVGYKAAGGHQLTDARPNLIAPPDLLSRLHRIGICRENVSCGDFLAVALSKPAQRREAGLNCKGGVPVSKVPCGACNGPRVGGRAMGKLDRQVQSPGLLGCGEPSTLVARAAPDEVAENFFRCFGRILVPNRPVRREV